MSTVAKALNEAVLAPMMPTALVYRGDAPANLDDATSTGIYSIRDNKTAPSPNGIQKYGTLIVIACKNYINQIYIPYPTSNNISHVTRTYDAGVPKKWFPWIVVYGTPLT